MGMDSLNRIRYKYGVSLYVLPNIIFQIWCTVEYGILAKYGVIKDGQHLYMI